MPRLVRNCARGRSIQYAAVCRFNHDRLGVLDRPVKCLVRRRIVGGMFASWDDREIEDLVRLMRKLADAMTAPGEPG